MPSSAKSTLFKRMTVNNRNDRNNKNPAANTILKMTPPPNGSSPGPANNMAMVSMPKKVIHAVGKNTFKKSVQFEDILCTLRCFEQFLIAFFLYSGSNQNT